MKTTRYLGTCGCCSRTIKVQEGNLVHHGYKRPGTGFIHGDCFGAKRLPHETSPEVAQEYRTWLVDERKTAQEALKGLPEKAQIEGVLVTRWNVELWRQVQVLVTSEHPDFQRGLEAEQSRLLARIESLGLEITRMDGMLKDWAPKALQTVEEEKAQKKAAKAAKAQEKFQVQLAKYQARIDSAARRNTFTALASIWEDAPHKLRELNRSLLTREDALKALDRDAVWTRLGVLVDGEYAPRDVHWKIRVMTVWPEAQ